jgi:uncharacterized protein YeeX (DUF496 family)
MPYKSKEEKAQYDKSYRAKNKEKRTSQVNDWYDRNPEKRLVLGARERAKKSGIDFAITHEDVIIPEYCPVLGIKITNKKDRDTSPSLDRIDNSKGYIKGNIAVISTRANLIKNYGSAAEHRMIADWMDKVLKGSVNER